MFLKEEHQPLPVLSSLNVSSSYVFHSSSLPRGEIFKCLLWYTGQAGKNLQKSYFFHQEMGNLIILTYSFFDRKYELSCVCKHHLTQTISVLKH